MTDEEKKAQEALEEKTEDMLVKLRDEPIPDESEGESTSEQSDEEQTDESQETDESTSEQSEETEQTDESESEEESTPEETSKEAEQTDDTSDSEAGELTQAEIRAAAHMEWSEEDIKELAKVDIELARKACAKALEGTNSLSRKFSEAGKAQTAKPAESVPTSTPTPEAKPIDFTPLEKEYENDPIVSVLKQVVERNEALTAEVGTLRADSVQSATKVDNAKVQEDAAISQQIDTFFERPDVTGYKEVYGEVEKGSKDWDNLTQGQIKKRWAVAEQANLIMLGAKQQGMDMPLDEAFERAHLLETEDVREQTIRKSIKAKAVKRSKSLTLEPTNSKKVPSTGQKTKAEIEANAARTLQKLRRS